MNLKAILSNYNTQEKCLAVMEKARWGKQVTCPYCKDAEHISNADHRYHCNNCKKSFSVTVGTSFEELKLPLPDLFLTVGLMLNSPQGISAMVLSRNTGLPYKTAWYTAMRIRCGMVESINNMRGTIEMDEMYVGGKPKKLRTTSNSPVISTVESEAPKRGRGTSRIKVAGMVERDGRVITHIMDTFNSYNMLQMLRRHVDEDKSVVMTDEARFYNALDAEVRHKTIKHKETYVKGKTHINTIEGFWSTIKNGIKGNYRVISPKYLPFYLTEFCYKYNRRKKKADPIMAFFKNALSHANCFADYKPVQPPRKLVLRYKKKPTIYLKK